MLDLITPLILTCNEVANLPRTLKALHWARRIVVVDSGSTDGTLEILREDPRIEIYYRAFDTFADQCAFGLGLIQTQWVLSLDADNVVTDELIGEISRCNPEDFDGWVGPYRYCIEGRPLRGSLFPPRVLLFRADRGVYENDGHGHHVRIVTGRVGRLRFPILHDDRKPLDRWLASQVKYSAQESCKLLATSWGELNWADRLRRCYLGPLLIVPFCLFAKGLVLDGRAGLAYTAQRLVFEVLLVLRLLHAKL